MIRLIAVAWVATSVVAAPLIGRLIRAGERHNDRAAANALGVEPHEVPLSEVRKLVEAIEALKLAENVGDLAKVGGWLG